MKEFLKILFWFIIPGAIVLWILLEAWQVVCAYAFFSRYFKLNSNNTKIFSQWGWKGFFFQGEAGFNATKGRLILVGFQKFYLLLIILLSPSFYWGIFNRNKPQGNLT